jgi:hypothetical protein
MFDPRKVRNMNRSLYGKLYAELPLAFLRDRFRCFYCGQPAGTIDHQPPLDVIASLLTSEMSFECVKVPCCHSCNSHLGSFPSITLSERFEELKNRLRRKYRTELRLQGQWTIDEIMELGDSLRQMVLGSVRLGIDAEERLLYPGHRLVHPEAMSCDGFMRECQTCGLMIEDRQQDVCTECGASLK